MEFGNVQRGSLGIEGAELNGPASKELGINNTDGFYINKVTKNTGAEKAGLTKGDIIIKLDNKTVSSFADLAGYINTKRPNDKVQVTFLRNNKTMVVPVTLTKNELISTEFKGIELEDISASDKKKFNLGYGVKIKNITNERFSAYANDLEGGIILQINNTKVKDVETVSRMLSGLSDNQSVQIEMLTTSGQLLRFIL